MYLISLTTTPTRINNFIYLLDYFNKQLTSSVYKVIINVAPYYKRFSNKIYLSDYSKDKLNEYSDKFQLNICYDYGAFTKYAGGIEYMKKNDLQMDLLIIDDDIIYEKKYLESFTIFNLSQNNMTLLSGSGFNIINGIYRSVENNPTYLEGFAGIYFPYKLLNDDIIIFSQYYKCMCVSDISVSEPNKFLVASFLADDFIISHFYKHKRVIPDIKNKLKIMEYGLKGDALKYNCLFGSNMGTYNKLLEDKHILNHFINLRHLHKEFHHQVKLYCH